MTRSRTLAVITLAVLLGALASYGGSLHSGLIYDDYLILRPHSWQELREVWHGSWEQTGVLPVFFRPLAVWSDALAFWLLGTHAVALHAVAVVELGVSAFLIGLFARREGDSVGAGVVASALCMIHPALTSAAGMWIFEQNHRLSLMAVSLALLVWQRVRSRSDPLAWSPLAMLAMIGFLLKEDAVMILPAVAGMQFLWSRIDRRVRPPTAGLMCSVLALCAGLFLARRLLLGEWGVLDWAPSAALIELAVRNLARGPIGVAGSMRGLFLPATWQSICASSLSVVWLIAGMAAIARDRSQPTLRLAAAGLVTLIAFDAPLAVASNATRWHLIGVGAVLLYSACALALWSLASRHRVQWIAAVFVTMALAVFCAESRSIVDAYQPCSPATRDADRRTLEAFDSVPALRDSWAADAIARKWQACDRTGEPR